ncbi:DUF4097 family beta strand repeat-containing protein [Streptomyces luteocolor]|uniref:DUF4097 family beta strand repeat-containing protein n=1 Tax=Streptomyces luteocolor TaxID=285500 RepID=UPI0008539FD1|nr:DUF4097 family beta strand repeat-containing protein [Streptomyces luteocolor]
MQKFATPAAVTAVLDIAAGHIRLIATDRTDTTVEIRPADAGKSHDVRAAEDLQVTYADGTLSITAPDPKNRLLGNSGAVEITVQLPAGSHLDATTAIGGLRGVGRLGNVTVDAQQATITLDETAGARLTVLDGDITVGRLTGPADLTAKKGDLHVTEATRGDLTLRTDHGDITVGAASTTSATLDADTAYGRVHNSLNNSAGADAALAVRATTACGDITASSL